MVEDKQVLLTVNDRHINFVQLLLKVQFPHLNSFRSTLKPQCLASTEKAIQIIYCSARQHWIVASALFNDNTKVIIYYSLFESLDETTAKVVMDYFGDMLW